MRSPTCTTSCSPSTASSRSCASSESAPAPKAERVTNPNGKRLTQIDNSFLVYEDAQPNCAMHVASTQIHEGAPLRRDDGSIDIERIEEYVLSRLDRIPRYRQKLAFTPIEHHPVWVDDPSFNI